MRYVILFLLILFTSQSLAKEEIRFGVFAYLGYEKTREEYEPMVSYINSILKDEVVILEVLKQDEIEQRIKDKTLDIVTTNPTHYLNIREKFQTQGVIATLLKESGDKYLSQLAGVIITRADNNRVKTIKDIKNKVVSTPSKQHMGGYRAQLYELYNSGVEEKDFKEIHQLVTHQAVVHHILAKKSEVGFVRDGVLEKMSRTNEIDLTQIKVINLKEYENFPYKVSTKLYPEWPVFGLSHTDERLIRRFAKAIFSIEPGTINGIYGYTPSVDYTGIEELARKLRLPPYEQAPDFNLIDIWDKWSYIIVFFTLSFVLIVILAIWLINLLSRVRIEKDFNNSLISGIGDGVVSLDSNFNILFINQVALELLGYTPDEFEQNKSQKILKLKQSCEEQINVQDCPIYKTSQDKKIRSVNDWFITKKNQLLPVNFTVAPMKEDGVIVVFRDISQILEYETTLEQQAKLMQELNENLEHRIEEEVEKNQKQNELIQQQSRLLALGELIGNIAHQWRQPLSIITGYVGNLQLQAELNGSISKEEINSSGDKIVETATYLSSTIESFRALVSQDKPYQKFIIQDSFNQAYSLVEGLIIQYSIDVNIKSDKDIEINGFLNELTEVFINMLNNSIDVLSGKNLKARVINVEFIDLEDKVIITIHDNGGGIDEDNMSRIFDPYFTTKHKSQGVGLGLFICAKNIKQSFHGNLSVSNKEIIVDSQIYIGAKFVIEISK